MNKSQKTYLDTVRCPAGHKFKIARRMGTAGKIVRTYCWHCDKAYQIKAGRPVSADSAGSGE